MNPRLFYFSYQALCERLTKEQKSKSGDPDVALVAEIEAALQFITEDFSSVIAEIDCLTRERQISFDLLWAFIPPKTLVYYRDHFTEQDMILRAKAVSYGARQDGGRYAEVSCDLVHDDGDSFGLASHAITIDEFSGLRNVRDLNAYPLSFHPQANVIHAKAVARAQQFLPIKQHLYETRGSAVRLSDDGKVCKFWVSGLTRAEYLCLAQLCSHRHTDGS